MGKLRDTIARESIREAISSAFQVWLWPYVIAIGGGAVTMLSGFVSPVPLPYLIAASSLVLGALAWGALQLSMLRERNRVRDRLYFDNVWFGRDCEIREGKVYLTAVQFGFYLVNAAPFPMNFKVLELRTNFDGRINPDPKYEDRSGIVIKDRPSLYRDAAIPLSDGIPVGTSERFEGTLYFKVAYDRTQAFRYVIKHNLKIQVTASETDASQFHLNWSYADDKGGTND